MDPRICREHLERLLIEEAATLARLEQLLEKEHEFITSNDVDALEKADAKVRPLRDPTVLPKATKNPVEIAGQKAAQERDGVAVARFLHWIDEEAPNGEFSHDYTRIAYARELYCDPEGAIQAMQLAI